MARTVDTSSTFEDWRQNYNDLANDVGSLGSLTTANKSSIVNAVNYIMDQYFYFQDFDFDGQDGATSNTVFSGNDNAGNALAYSSGKLLVFKNGALLRNGTDYTATTGTSVVLVSGAILNDIIEMIVYSTFSVNNSYTKTEADTRYPFKGNNSIIRLNGQTISADITIDSDENGVSAGPITQDNATVTVNGYWSIV